MGMCVTRPVHQNICLQNVRIIFTKVNRHLIMGLLQVTVFTPALLTHHHAKCRLQCTTDAVHGGVSLPLQCNRQHTVSLPLPTIAEKITIQCKGWIVFLPKSLSLGTNHSTRALGESCPWTFLTIIPNGINGSFQTQITSSSN